MDLALARLVRARLLKSPKRMPCIDLRKARLLVWAFAVADNRKGWRRMEENRLGKRAHLRFCVDLAPQRYPAPLSQPMESISISCASIPHIVCAFTSPLMPRPIACSVPPSGGIFCFAKGRSDLAGRNQGVGSPVRANPSATQFTSVWETLSSVRVKAA